MKTSSPVLVLFLSLAVAAAAFADAGKVSGSITANGKTTALKYGYAMPKEDPFDKKKKDIFVLVTDQEVPAAALADEFEFMRWRDKANLHGFSALIDNDKSVISGNIYDPGLKHDGFSAIGMQKVELTVMTPSHITGKVYIPKPEEFFGDKYEYTATFDLPVAAAKAVSVETVAPKGKPLPAGGGEPAKAYAIYSKALAAGDMEGVKRGVSADRAKEMNSPDFKKMFGLIQALQPKNIKITGGSIDGDTATLLATGKDESGPTHGTITMVKENGAWKVQEEEWKSK